MKHLLTLLFSFIILTSVAQTFTMNGTNITSCTGTFLDPGGAGNYANSQDFTVTICPSLAEFEGCCKFPFFCQ
ncbi:MAG: hypothetical protein IPL10_14665 [Bacteroidetes bacterium]|nr:hypothetical protein [Bacteroidota bacterium]